MGYDMRWINGADEGDDPEQFATRSRFQATDRTMAALRQEMERQGMLGLDAIASVKLERGAGDVVTRDELMVALLRSTNDPTTSDREIPTEQWHQLWEGWLNFLSGGLQYGGFTVNRALLH